MNLGKKARGGRSAVQSSSMIKSFDYDSKTQTLRLEFDNGSISKYHDVPDSINQGLNSAVSRVQYFNANIKEKYGHDKVR